MENKRTVDGRLNMDAVRGYQGMPEISSINTAPQNIWAFSSSQIQPVSTQNVVVPPNQYTAAWLNQLGSDQRLISTDMRETVCIDQTKAYSAPALSVKSKSRKSRKSTKSSADKEKLELELKTLRERQRIDKENRELEFHMRRQEMEIERQMKLAEINERRRLLELEERLNAAKIAEQEESEVSDSESEDSIIERAHIVVENTAERELFPGQINTGHVTNQLNLNQPLQYSLPAQQPVRSPEFLRDPTVQPVESSDSYWRNQYEQLRLQYEQKQREQIEEQKRQEGMRRHASFPPQFTQVTPYQMFQQQQEALKLMAATIGSTISKGFEMPKREYMSFDGDPLKYPSFIENFKTNVENVEPDPNARRQFLIQLCTGVAKDAISGTVMLPPEQGYFKARSILHETFGQTHIIAAAHVDRVTKGDLIREYENEKLMQLARDMENCEMNLSQLGYSSDINSRSNISAVVLRLPKYLRSEWAKEAEVVRGQGKEPDFKCLTRFVVKKAKLANSEYGRLVSVRVEEDRSKGKQKPKQSSKQSDSLKKVSTFTAQASAEGKPESSPDKARWKKVKCLFCDKDNHTLDKCFKFLEKTYNDRRAFVRKEELCNLCLAKGHYSNKCKLKSTCLVPECGKRHHSCLHPVESGSKPASSEVPVEDPVTPVVKSAHTCGTGTVNELNKRVCLRIIPVRVFGRDNDSEEITYAIRDEGSNTTLVKESLVNKLKLKGEPVDFQLTTMNCVSQESSKSHFLYVQGLNQKDCIEIPNALSVKDLSVVRSCIPTTKDFENWRHLNGIEIPELDNPEVTILIGTDVPEAHWKLEERRGKRKEPYAIRTPLGWSVAGPVGPSSKFNASSYFIRKEDEFLGETVTRMFEMDFSETSYGQSAPMSIEDQKALHIMDSSVKVVDGHYQLDLPFKGSPNLPNNRVQAERRLNSLKVRLKKDPDLYTKYCNGIHDYLKKGYAEKIQEEDNVKDSDVSSVWYLPHHPVFHPQKPEKPRIVFDCAASYGNVSLNKQLLQGPDMTNRLVGVLLRFRENYIAFMADIEAMFCQVRVSPEHRDLLRFLWWKNDDYNQPPEEYRMAVHLFGATSSPSCAGFCLRKAADEFESEYDQDTLATIRRNFYVDDCLKSIPDVEKAIRLVGELCDLLAKRSFHLTKFVSNSLEVLSSIPEKELSPSVVSLDFDALPVERALGIHWNVKDDVFTFRIIERKNQATRRGILSDVSSMYDPLGFAAPFILPAKRLLQQLCKDNVGWDEEISPQSLEVWQRWLNDLPNLQHIRIPRCFKSLQLGQLKEVQLHHFSDASTKGYGAVSYLRCEDVNGNVNCSLVIGKSRVSPSKPVTIPRLELTAATVAVKQDRQIQEELDIKFDAVVFWTDSTCVLQYINSEAGRFKTFVANRIALIHESSSPSQWRYVNSESNPADYASRGLRSDEKVKIDQWVHGPYFLRKGEEEWPKCPEGINSLPDENLEWKKSVQVFETQMQDQPLDKFIKYYSSWYKLQKSTAWLLRFIQYLRNRHLSSGSTGAGVGPLTVKELENSRLKIIGYVQRKSFSEEFVALKNSDASMNTKKMVKKSSRLSTLSPFISEGVLRVGGRLDRASISFDAKHPIIVPNKHHIADLIIQHYHQMEGHSGARQVLATIQQEFWILQGRSRIRWLLSKCVPCRRRYAPPGQQVMAPLPSPRVTALESPFTSTGVDYFGPFLVKRGRSQVKRYGCIFTCLAVRAVHIEMTHSLDAESFLCAFSRFTARRGYPRDVYSDNGTNFVGACGVLKEEFAKLMSDQAQAKIYDRLRMKGVTFHFNPPLASHAGGVWERMIKSTRRILRALLKEQSVDDETLETLLVEVERILNDRPLLKHEGQLDDLDPLTPSKLLLLRSNSSLPPGVFVAADQYSKRWRQAQLLASTFWKRWVREYLPTLQERQKWQSVRRNLKVGDLVLMVDERFPRGQWPMALVHEVYPDEFGVVRHVTVRKADGMLKRDVRKLCLLEGAE